MFSETFKPYLLQSFYQWCVDYGSTPYLMITMAYPGIVVDDTHAQAGRLMVDISPAACEHLQVQDGFVRFEVRAGGAIHKAEIPFPAILGIYSAETKQGFSLGDPDLPLATRRPSLRVVK